MIKLMLRTDIKRQRSLICFGLLCILLLSACNENNDGERGSGSSAPPDISINITAGEAIEQVQNYVGKQGGIITAPSVPYQEPEVERKPCSQIDVDTDPNKNDEFLAKCKPIGGTGGAPYGYKQVTVWTTKCCRPETVQLPISGKWSADYSSSTDSWSVRLEFEIESIEQLVTWSVDDDTGNISDVP